MVTKSFKSAWYVYSNKRHTKMVMTRNSIQFNSRFDSVWSWNPQITETTENPNSLLCRDHNFLLGWTRIQSSPRIYELFIPPTRLQLQSNNPGKYRIRADTGCTEKKWKIDFSCMLWNISACFIICASTTYKFKFWIHIFVI